MNWQDYELEQARLLEYAQAEAATMPLEDIDVAHWDIMRNDTIWPYFQRLRKDAPVYHHKKSIAGPFWSVTDYESIKAVDTNATQFSSEPTIGLNDVGPDNSASSFISMDDPQHAIQTQSCCPGCRAAQSGSFGTSNTRTGN